MSAKERKKGSEPGYMVSRSPNLDEYLEMVGLWRKLVPRDGRCLFRSIAEQIFGTQTACDELLMVCAKHLEENTSKFSRYLTHPVDQYLTSVRKAQTCAAHPHLDVFLEIVSQLFDCVIVVYYQVSVQPLVIWTKQNHRRTIELCKIGKHYDTIMSRDRVSAYAQCQSVLFDLLYSKVFCMPEDEIDFGIGALRHKVNKRKDSGGEGLSFENADDSGNGGEANELSPNKMPFSYRAAKGLDMNIFRNIAFDIWREENLDRASGEQLLIPGNQCIVQLNDSESGSGAVDSEAIIQDYDYEGQIVSAFVQSLGMRVEVPREAVKPSADRCNSGAELAKVTSKRRYGVKQDVHWHNRPDVHPRHGSAQNVMYWTGSPGTGPVDSSPPEEPAARRHREKSSNDSQLTVQVSPRALAVAAQQAGYPASQVPSLMGSTSSSRCDPNVKPLAKVYFNSVGKPAVCKLQLPRYVTPRKSWHPVNDGLESSGPVRPDKDASGGGKPSPRRSLMERPRCSSESTESVPVSYASPSFPSLPPVMNAGRMSAAQSSFPTQQHQDQAEGAAAEGPADQGPNHASPWFFQFNVPYMNNVHFRMGAYGHPFPAPHPAPAQLLPFPPPTALTPQHQQTRPSPLEGQAVRVIPLMEIEHSHQQAALSQVNGGQAAAPAHIFAPGVSMASQPPSVFAHSQPPSHGFPMEQPYSHMYYGSPYYSLAAQPTAAMDAGPLFSMSEGASAPGSVSPHAPTMSAPPAWGFSPTSAFCYM